MKQPVEIWYTLDKTQLLEVVKKLHAENVQQHRQIIEQHHQIESLRHQLSLLQKAVFGKKSEIIHLQTPGQLQIDFASGTPQGIQPQAPDATEGTEETQPVTYTRRAPRKKREDFSKLELPDHLERVETVIEPLDIPEGSVKIGEKRTELLAVRPGEFFVHVLVRPLYSKPGKQGVTTAPMPSRPIQGGQVHVSVLVMVLVDKFLYHMPLDRQRKKYRNMGMDISESTLCNWVHRSINLLEYLFEEHQKIILQSTYLQADETIIKVLDKIKKNTTHQGYYWVYHCPLTGGYMYLYDKGRGKSAPAETLENFHGYLQTDGFSVYSSLDGDRDTITHLCCMAHARRYFFDAQTNNKTLAHQMLSKLQALYRIEEAARNAHLTHAERYALRQKESVPILADMKTWLDENQLRTTPASPIGKAITYMLQRWDKLTRYTTSGQLEIDNNRVENAMRPIALGRKNYLFAGSHDAAYNHGIIYSFAATCKALGVNFNQWLTDTLTLLPDTKKSQLHTLLPKPQPSPVLAD